MHTHASYSSSTAATDDSRVPEGIAFLELVAARERECRETTLTERQNMGEKAPKCLSAIGTVLSLLDRTASCWWGCDQGSHLLEYLIGRSVASAMAALHAAQSGYYDEALNQVRSLGEIANLLALFAVERNSLVDWTTASKKERLSKFGPSAVRKRLTQISAPMPVSAERYAALCEIVTHPTPDTRPQSYNPLGMPSVGQTFQPAGYLVTLNEIALPLFSIGYFASVLVTLPPEIRVRLRSEAHALAEAGGGVNLMEGYPVLTDDARRKLLNLLHEASEEDRPFLQKAILDMAQRASIAGTDSQSDSVGDLST
jgi:hypothetical protein